MCKRNYILADILGASFDKGPLTREQTSCEARKLRIIRIRLQKRTDREIYAVLKLTTQVENRIQRFSARFGWSLGRWMAGLLGNSGKGQAPWYEMCGCDVGGRGCLTQQRAREKDRQTSCEETRVFDGRRSDPAKEEAINYGQVQRSKNGRCERPGVCTCYAWKPQRRSRGTRWFLMNG